MSEVDRSHVLQRFGCHRSQRFPVDIKSIPEITYISLGYSKRAAAQKGPRTIEET